MHVAMCGVCLSIAKHAGSKLPLIYSLSPSDSAWPVFIFPEEVGTRCNISGVNVLTFQSGVPGRSVGKLSIFNPADSSHPLVSWELHNMRRRGSTGDLFFIEIGRHCEGGPGLVLMYAGLKDAQTLREMLRK